MRGACVHARRGLNRRRFGTTRQFHGGPVMTCCPGNPLNRRDFLTVGAIGGLGLSLPTFFQLEQAQAAAAATTGAPRKEGSAKSVIYIFLPGGIAHQESFDPKPYAPVEYRGPFGSIDT